MDVVICGKNGHDRIRIPVVEYLCCGRNAGCCIAGNRFTYNKLFRQSRQLLSHQPGIVAVGHYHTAFMRYKTLQPVHSRLDHRPVAEQRSEEHTSELQSRGHLVCRLLLEKKKDTRSNSYNAYLYA